MQTTKALLIDLDGVLYVGNKPINDAKECIDWIQNKNIPHLFLTNTTSRPRAALVEKLAGIGIYINSKRILTPAVAACRWLKENVSGEIYLLVPDITKREFNNFTIADDASITADAIVVGDLGEKWSYSLLNHAFKILIENPNSKLIALGMSRYWRATEGLRLDVAPFVVALEYASDKKAIVLGKPAKEFYAAALNLLGFNADNVIMIGDDIRADIDGAQQCGIRGILVKTGKFQEIDLDSDITPYKVIDSIANLPTMWQVIDK